MSFVIVKFYNFYKKKYLRFFLIVFLKPSKFALYVIVLSFKNHRHSNFG